MPQTHQLAAIMFADIMGYTSIMQEDEMLAMRLREKLKYSLVTEVNRHGGKIIKISGDGALCIFSSAIESVKAACAIQLDMHEDPKVPLRIGIHQSDVIFEEEDVYGDGVNIASRLESFAVPGSILISAKVYDDIKNQRDIQTVSLGKYVFKNVKEPVEVFAVSNPGLNIPDRKKIEGKGIKFQPSRVSLKKISRRTIGFSVTILGLSIVGFFFVQRWMKIQKARNEWIPEIQKIVEDNFNVPSKAFGLAKKADKYIASDSVLLKLWPKISWQASVQTYPPGAKLYWKDYNDVDGEWNYLATTPFKNLRLPTGSLRYKIEKKGFETIYQPGDTLLNLDSIGKLPENMVRVHGRQSHMLIVGLEHNGGKYVSEFLIDKFEVTNKLFKRFVDAGGYKTKQYWDYPVSLDGKEIPWEQAMSFFHDKTGKSGPADWEVGNYPDGRENHPVTGISWYEAMAYAKFTGKTLPNVYQWSLVANTWDASSIVPKSNFNSKGTVAVGILEGISNWGVYDIAGNLREWCLNESSEKGWHYILGGSWSDPTYAFNDGHAEPAVDRSLTNGFRCVKLLPGDSTYNKLAGPVSFAFRDYFKEKPVDDKTFDIFLRQYSYDHSPLNPELTVILDSNLCKIEKINLDAVYNKERFTVYLFLPKNSAPPYQTILFYPHAGAIYLKQFNYTDQLFLFDFLLRSGRAVVFPIFKGTFERRDELRSDLQNETVFYKEHVISWARDVGRTLDYLETRSDISRSQFGYYGFSWGSEIAPVICAVEPRFKAAVYHVGGLVMQKTLPETDPFNFLSRVKIPVLMLNGKNDTFFPVETSQKPMYKLLGSPDKDKKIIIYEGGHTAPRSELIKESLTWFDKYLGVVGSEK